MSKKVVDIQEIREKIYNIRGIKVMLDRDLAVLYRVETKHLKRQVNRNIRRFPKDFMFQLTKEEFANWRYQNGTSKADRMGLRYAPYAFTEFGVAMLSSVLNSETAVQINIKIMRAFVELRQIIVAQPEYELLKETIKRIESNMLVENKLASGKLIKLSQKVQALSALFDTFQDAYLVIRRPDEGSNKG